MNLYELFEEALDKANLLLRPPKNWKGELAEATAPLFQRYATETYNVTLSDYHADLCEKLALSSEDVMRVGGGTNDFFRLADMLEHIELTLKDAEDANE